MRKTKGETNQLTCTQLCVGVHIQFSPFSGLQTWQVFFVVPITYDILTVFFLQSAYCPPAFKRSRLSLCRCAQLLGGMVYELYV